jgi:hypothetical protein
LELGSGSDIESDFLGTHRTGFRMRLLCTGEDKMKDEREEGLEVGFRKENDVEGCKVRSMFAAHKGEKDFGMVDT